MRKEQSLGQSASTSVIATHWAIIIEIVAFSAGSGMSPSEQARMNETMQALDRAIDSLPVELPGAFILGEIDQLSHKEISSIFGISPKAVEVRSYRARKIFLNDLQVKALPLPDPLSLTPTTRNGLDKTEWPFESQLVRSMRAGHEELRVSFHFPDLPAFLVLKKR